jgi:hypothetical protein
MLPVIIIVIAAYLAEYLYTRWQRYRRAARDRAWKRAARIDIPGADRLGAATPGLQRLGLPLERVLDICVIRGPLKRHDIAPRAMAMLKTLYAAGQAPGLDTRELALTRRDLAAGEGLYLISLDARPRLHCMALLAPAGAKGTEGEGTVWTYRDEPRSNGNKKPAKP